MSNPNDKSSSSKKLHLTRETVKALTVRTGCKTGFLLQASGACLAKTTPANPGRGQCQN
jgi:hypothetical protein